MRFANEAMNYNDFVREMIRLDMLTYKGKIFQLS